MNSSRLICPGGINAQFFSGDAALVRSEGNGVWRVLAIFPARGKERKSITDFGCVGDNATDNAVNLQNAVNAAAIGGFALYIPEGIFVCNSSITMPTATGISIRGASPQLSVIATNVNGPLFDWNVTVTITHCEFKGFACVNRIATGGSYSNSCVFGISGNNTSFFQNHRFVDIDAYSFYSFFKVTKAAISTVFGLESPVAFNTFDRIGIYPSNNNAACGWLYTLGSGTNSYTNCDVIITTAMIWGQGSGCVVGDIRVVGCNVESSSGSSAIVKVDAGTVYNQRILITGCQPDGGCDYPISLDSTGSHDYNNIVIDAKNIGGTVDLYTPIPPIRNSRIVHMDVGEWRVGNFKTTNATGAQTMDMFLVDLGGIEGGSPVAFTGTYIELVVAGLVDGGVILKRYAVQLSTTASVTVLESSGKPVPGSPFFDVTTTLSGTTIKFSVTFTPSSAGSTIDAQLRTMGGGVRVKRL